MRLIRHPERVLQDMVARGWTQAELARRARVTEAAVSRLLNNKTCSVTQIARVAKVLGQPVERYVTVDESVDEEPANAGTSSCVLR